MAVPRDLYSMGRRVAPRGIRGINRLFLQANAINDAESTDAAAAAAGSAW